MAKRSTNYVLSQAQKSSIQVKNGSKHYKMYGPDGSMMALPRDLKGNGTEARIVKWFLRFGIVIIFLIFVQTLF